MPLNDYEVIEVKDLPKARVVTKQPIYHKLSCDISTNNMKAVHETFQSNTLYDMINYNQPGGNSSDVVGIHGEASGSGVARNRVEASRIGVASKRGVAGNSDVEISGKVVCDEDLYSFPL